MKTILLLSVFAFSSQAIAVQDKCYITAKDAAFKYAVSEEMVSTMDEFGMLFGNEHIELDINNGWQKEYWAFGDGSKFILITVDAVMSKCFVKKIEIAQDDQDHE